MYCNAVIACAAVCVALPQIVLNIKGVLFETSTTDTRLGQTIYYLHGMAYPMFPKPNLTLDLIHIIKRASLINFAGVYFLGPGVSEYRGISFENHSPVQLEMQDCFLDAIVLDMHGPGSYRFQGTYVTNRGMSRAALVVDDPNADSWPWAGEYEIRRRKESGIHGDDIFNVWQERRTCTYIRGRV